MTNMTNKKLQYNFISLEQGSPEWLEFRKSRVGSSDIASILGIDGAYSDEHKLIMDKIGQGKETSEYVQTKIFDVGHGVEETIRSEHMEGFRPCVIASAQNDRLIASFDGVRVEGGVILDALEVKSTKVDKVIEKVKAGVVPEIYLCQTQWQMGLAGLTEMSLIVVDIRDGTAYKTIVKADQLAFEMMKQSAELFLRKLDDAPALIERLSLDASVEFIRRGTARIKKIQAILDEMNEKIKKTAESLLIKNDATKLEVNGLSFQWIEPRGAVDYSKIELLKTVNLDEYRKKGSRYVKIVLKEPKQIAKGND